MELVHNPGFKKVKQIPQEAAIFRGMILRLK